MLRPNSKSHGKKTFYDTIKKKNSHEGSLDRIDLLFKGNLTLVWWHYGTREAGELTPTNAEEKHFI